MTEFVADLDSSFSAQLSDDSLTISIEISKIPEEVVDRIRENMDEISSGMIRALFAQVGGVGIKPPQGCRLAPGSTRRNLCRVYWLVSSA